MVEPRKALAVLTDAASTDKIVVALTILYRPEFCLYKRVDVSKIVRRADKINAVC
jgi:hypothetical protein